MLKVLFAKVKKIRKYATAQLVSVVLAVVFLCMTLQIFASGRDVALWWAFAAVDAVLAVTLHICSQRLRQIKAGHVWRIPVNSTDVVALLDADALDEDTYGSLITQNGSRIRMVIHAAGRGASPIRSAGKAPFWSSPCHVRVDLMVVDNAGRESESYVQRHFLQGMSLGESKLNLVLACDTGELLFPDCSGELMISEIRKYQAVAKLMASSLCA